MATSQQILQQYWGFESFRGLQQNIVEAVLQKQDVLALLPTGGGKSICFQVPALLNEGVCIVVSPLIALMKDQVQNLVKKNIDAVAIYSGLTNKQVEQILINATEGRFKFLYVSPERLQSKIFKEYIDDIDVNLIAVDEAHCISQWGYDFRPPYLNIKTLRNSKPNVPIIALTASATKLVQDDIIKKLKLNNVAQFQQSFEKPNISYSVFNEESKINKVIDILNNVTGSSIIYCKNRKQTSNVAHLLQIQNISATHYHAGLPQDERNEKQQSWLNNKTRVMVCTNAFGMGIDKPDVKTVIHYDAPDCIENYYQEAGRVGRDGKRAFAILLYTNNDIDALKQLPELRFPSIIIIKKVYEALVNYLQIANGLGEGLSFDFDVVQFCKNFNLETIQTLNVLKTLEQENHITVTDAIYTPSKIQVIAARESIESFAEMNRKLATTFKGLLRTYIGILDNEVFINEKLLSKATQQSYQKVEEDLNELSNYKMIHYTRQKDIPQIIFNTNRTTAENLYINTQKYNQRKKLFEQKVQQMLVFIEDSKECRSVFISNYFDAGFVKKCNCCDNCLAIKSTEITKEEFEFIENKIKQMLQTDVIHIKDLLDSFKTLKKEKTWKVIHFLEDEKVIHINSQGMVKLL